MFNAIINFLSKIYRSLGTKSKIINKITDYFTHIPLNIGLSYKYGTLYGWTIYDKLHNPEPETVSFFQKHLKLGDSVVDIGANIGYYTLLFSDLVGEKGRVTAFEPSPTAFNRLSKAARNKKNITLINKGIFSRNDTLKLYSKRKADPMGSMMYVRGSHFDEVQVVPLRDYPEKFTFAKIDVEGAELEVLRSMKTPIKAMLEVAKGILSERGGVSKFLSDIYDMGYKIFFIKKDGITVPYTGDNLDLLESNIYIEPRLNSLT